MGDPPPRVGSSGGAGFRGLVQLSPMAKDTSATSHAPKSGVLESVLLVLTPPSSFNALQHSRFMEQKNPKISQWVQKMIHPVLFSGPTVIDGTPRGMSWKPTFLPSKAKSIVKGQRHYPKFSRLLQFLILIIIYGFFNAFMVSACLLLLGQSIP